MLIGYVSDERYVALPDVQLEFEGPIGSVEVRSRAGGSVRADLPTGTYQVTLAKAGYGSKRVRLTLPMPRPYQFRLLADRLLGYAWPKWVRVGDKAEFRVHSPEPYKLTLWRHGLDKQLVRNLGWYDEHGPRATVQITPDGDYTQTGIEWNKHGYSSPHHKQWVEAPEPSGLYYFHAQTANGASFSFPWIVAPSKPSAPVAILASNLAWNAYNNFGGRSNYIHPDHLPPTPTVNARLELKRYTDPEHINYDTNDYAPLSFERPEPINDINPKVQVTDPIEGRAACHLAPAEWRLIGWLDREGFDFDLYAESQLHDGTLDLDAYQVLILGPHPEYWTKPMFQKVKSWVFERGGRLLYLGGNGINCEVELPTPDTMICRNGDQREVTRRGLESRFHLSGESEASLLGVAYDDRGIMTAAPFRVLEPSHWIFSGTGVREGSLFGRRSLHMRCEGGASGHETDKRTPSSPENIRVLARGANPDEGGAELILYTTPSGGAVYSAGSITYASCLLVDEPVSKATSNVLHRFLGKLPIRL